MANIMRISGASGSKTKYYTQSGTYNITKTFDVSSVKKIIERASTTASYYSASNSFKSYGSNDNSTWTPITTSTQGQNIDKEVTNIYKYYKIEAKGDAQGGASITIVFCDEVEKLT